MFKDKYIEFNSDTTYKMFEQFYDKLIDAGWESIDKDTLWGQFSSGTWPFIVGMTGLTGNEFYSRSNSGNKTKTTMQAILAYKSEVLSLPKRWCVKTGDPSLTKSFDDWRKTTMFGSFTGTPGYLTETGFYSYPKPFDSTLITFEQFEKWVLFKVPTKWYPGSYVLILKEGNGIRGKLHTVHKIITFNERLNVINLQNDALDIAREERGQIKWFKTIQDAEDFILTLHKEVNWKEASEKDLIEECERRYPIGTTCKTLAGNSTICTVSGYTHSSFSKDEGWLCGEGINPLVFQKGKWAEIVKLPEEKPDELKSGTLKLDFNFTVGNFYKITLDDKYKHIFQFTKDSLKDRRRITLNYYFDINDKQLCQGGQFHLGDVTSYDHISTEYVKTQYSELYDKIYPKSKFMFEEGKWYALDADQNENTSFRKCCRSSHDWECKYDERIDSKQYLKSTGTAYWGKSNPANMDIVNKLLNKKVEEFKYKEGVWYSQASVQGLRGTYVKCSKSSNSNELKYSEKLYNGKYCKESATMFWPNSIPADMNIVNKIIDDYTLRNEPDPGKPNPNLNPYKIGDWVIVTKEFEGCNGKLGQLYNVLDTPTSFYIRYDKCANIDIKVVETRLATDAEIESHLYGLGKSMEIPVDVHKKSYKGYSVGHYITITRKPKMWSSRCNGNNLQEKVLYPFTAQITKLELDGDDCHIEAGNGGWALCNMIKENSVRKATSFEIGNTIHKEMDSLLNAPSQLISQDFGKHGSKQEYSAIKKFDDEVDFLYLSED